MFLIIYFILFAVSKNEQASVQNVPTDKAIAPKTAKKISDLPFERSVVSSKLAAALITEGKEDVSTEEMDKLIFLLILMTKISKGNDKRVNSKEICEFLKIQRSRSPTPPPVATKQVIDIFSKDEIESMKMVVNSKDSKPSRKEEPRFNDSVKDTSGASGLDCLTDSDLQTLLQNFKHLSSEEQHHLIAHLKKLESTDPLRVEKLRKYVNISDDEISSKKPSFEIDEDDDSRSINESPPPPPSCKTDSRKINISDDDEDEEDYNFEDVVKSITAKNLQPKQALNPPRPVASTSNAKPTPPISIADTQNLIANLMGSLQKTNPPMPQTPQQQPPPPSQPPAPQMKSHPQQSTNSLPFYQQNAQQQFVSYPHLNNMNQPQQQMNAGNPYYNYYQQQPQQMNYGNYNMGYPQQQQMNSNYNMYGNNPNMQQMNNGRASGGGYN